MPIKDFGFWLEEARLNSLRRKSDAYDAALLPFQKSDTIKTERKRIQLKIMEIEKSEEISEVEKENEVLIRGAEERKKLARNGKRTIKTPPPRAKKISLPIGSEK